MLEVTVYINGFYPIGIGHFYNIHETIAGIKEHVRVHSAITQPRYSKSMSGDSIRIDYGAPDCYYLIEKGGKK